MARLHEGAGGVVDQHGFGRIVSQDRQARLHRVRALGAPPDDADAIDPGHGLGRGLLFAFSDDHDQPLGARRRQSFGGPAEHRLSGEQPPLLGAIPACAAARSCGGDDG